MKKPHTPLLLRITNGKMPPLMVGVLVSLFTLVVLTVAFEMDNIVKSWPVYKSQSAFYTMAFGYLVYISRIIQNSHKRQFAQLLDSADLDTSQKSEFEGEFENHRRLWPETIIAAIVGLVQAYYGLIQVVIEGTTNYPYLYTWRSIQLTMVWIVITQSISIYTRNMTIMNKLSSHIDIDLLKLQNLMPLTKAGIVSILAFIGVYSIMFAVKFKSSDLVENPAIYVLIPTIVVMIYRPLKGIRKRIVLAKETEVKLIEAGIEGDMEALKQSRIGKNLKNINVIDLINYKKIIEGTLELPVNIPTASRFVLYLIIPLLTWVAASIVDKGIDYLIK